MIIVSQDKKEIINFENILSVKFFHDDEDNECLYEIYATVNAPGDNYILLGEYNTEERAKEVLQEIYQAYTVMKLVNIPDMKFERAITAEELKECIEYKMPKE